MNVSPELWASQPDFTACGTGSGDYQLLLFVSGAREGGDEDLPQDALFPSSRKKWKKLQ